MQAPLRAHCTHLTPPNSMAGVKDGPSPHPMGNQVIPNEPNLFLKIDPVRMG